MNDRAISHQKRRRESKRNIPRNQWHLSEKKQGNNMNSSLLRTLQLLPYQTVSCTKIPPLRRHRLKFTRVQP